MNLEEVLRRLIAEDAAVRRLRGQIERGKGSFADAVRCLFREADLLGGLMRRNILSVPEGDRAALLDTLLRQRHAETFALLSEVQAQMDAQNGLHLAAQKAEYPAERVAKAGSALEDKTVPDEVIQRRAEAVSSNIAKSMSDDFFRKNAEFRSSAGLRCWIVRDAATGCCQWCTDMAGRYAYGDEPGDVYGRHDNCSCTVTYESGRQRQDVWSKRTWEAPAADAGADAPTVFTEETRPQGAGEPIRLSKAQAAMAQAAAEAAEMFALTQEQAADRLTGATKGAILDIIRGAGIRGQVHIPPLQINLTTLSIDEAHINDRNHGVTLEEAEAFISAAFFSVERWGGRFENYYGKNGAAYVDMTSNTVRTAFRSNEYDDTLKTLIEEVQKWMT